MESKAVAESKTFSIVEVIIEATSNLVLSYLQEQVVLPFF